MHLADGLEHGDDGLEVAHVEARQLEGNVAKVTGAVLELLAAGAARTALIADALRTGGSGAGARRQGDAPDGYQDSRMGPGRAAGAGRAPCSQSRRGVDAGPARSGAYLNFGQSPHVGS